MIGHRLVDLAIDGQRVATLGEGDRLACGVAAAEALFVRFGPHHFHQVLKARNRPRRPVAPRMLTELRIENVGVIREVQLLLGPGLWAVTGETGAGKTIGREALDLLLGGRADAVVVHTGRRRRRGSRAASTSTTPRSCWPASSAGPLPCLRRRAAGHRGPHSSRWARDSSTSTVSTPTRACSPSPPNARRCDASSARSTSSRCARHEHTSPRSTRWRRRSRATVDRKGAEIDLLRFQVNELDAAGLEDPAEDDELRRLEDLLADATAHREAAELAVEALTTDDGTIDAAGTAAAALADRAPFSAAGERLTNLLAELADVASEIRHTGEAIDDEPARPARGARAPSGDPRSPSQVRRHGRRGDDLPSRSGRSTA